MSKRASPTVVGAFVVGAVVLAIIAAGVFGSGRFFRHMQPAVLFFKGDVNGLKVGAPVKFKGIQVGTVKTILLSLGEVIGSRDSSRPFHIPVVIEIDGDSIVEKGITGRIDRETIESLVGRGLRGRLEMESFVTGVLYVDLDMSPETLADLQGGEALPYPEIPTLPTVLEEAQAKATAFLSKLNEVDVEGLVNGLKDAVKHVDEVVSSPDVKRTLAGLPPTLGEVSGAAAQVRGTFGKFEGLSPNADQALLAARDTLRSAGSILASDSPALYRLDQALDELSLAAAAIRRFAEDLERNPGMLVRGRAEPETEEK
jgi:paraquat-inducible protein B